MPWRQRAGVFSAWYQLRCEPTELLSKEENMLHLTTNKQKTQEPNKSTNYTTEKKKKNKQQNIRKLSLTRPKGRRKGI